jgi:hypothetical protein
MTLDKTQNLVFERDRAATAGLEVPLQRRPVGYIAGPDISQTWLACPAHFVAGGRRDCRMEWFQGRAQRDVGEALARLLASGPEVVSVDRIARAAAVSYRTVQRALERLEALGVLTRQARHESGLASGLIRCPSLLAFDLAGFAALKRAGAALIRDKLDAAFARVAVLRARRMARLQCLRSRSAMAAAYNEDKKYSSSSDAAAAEKAAIYALIGSGRLSADQEKEAWEKLALLESGQP